MCSNVDVSAALLVPGVVDVVTCKDIPGKKFRDFLGYEEELLADKEVLPISLSVCLGNSIIITTVFSVVECTLNTGNLLLCC